MNQERWTSDPRRKRASDPISVMSSHELIVLWLKGSLLTCPSTMAKLAKMSSENCRDTFCLKTCLSHCYSGPHGVIVIHMSIDQATLYQLLGTRIRTARARVGMSQAKLAEKLGMSRTSVVNIEAGRQHPPLHVVWSIAEELHTDVALLLPSQSEYEKEVEPIELDAKTIAKIEAAASGDPRTRRDLTAFIGRAKSSAKEAI